jgi:hypothetical protein
MDDHFTVLLESFLNARIAYEAAPMSSHRQYAAFSDLEVARQLLNEYVNDLRGGK